MTPPRTSALRAAFEPEPLSIVILGLSITSSWGNGHATTYRSLVRELCRRGHDVTFLERDMPWYAENRDLPRPPYGRTFLYRSVGELARCHAPRIEDADLVIVGSYVPEGVAVGRVVLGLASGLTAFYDIDTPVTLARLQKGPVEYISRDLIRRYDAYLSFTGGPTLQRLERELGARRVQAFYCSSDADVYRPLRTVKRWTLGYLGTYSADRQPAVEELLLKPAAQWGEARFVVAGPLYPDDTPWPDNVERLMHVPPSEHRQFYNSQRFTLNVTRHDMITAGYSPSVRLFEAAACGTPIVSDYWRGLETLFEIGREILVAESADDVMRLIRDLPEAERRAIGARARARVLACHTAAHRAVELEWLARDR